MTGRDRHAETCQWCRAYLANGARSGGVRLTSPRRTGPDGSEANSAPAIAPSADTLERAERQAAEPVDANGETWQTIPDWPAYQVSTQGRVRSQPRTVHQTGGRGGYPYSVAGGILKPVPNSRGGLMVTLYKTGARRSFHVKTLVRRAFGGQDG